MGYEESLKEAKALLIAEIKSLKDQLAHKEASLRKLETFLNQPAKKADWQGSLTQQIVEIVYRLVEINGGPVTAKDVVQEFANVRSDVNESTVRSTLYQVTRKQKATEIIVDSERTLVRVIKEGPIYDIEVVDSFDEEDEESPLKSAHS